MSSSQEELYNLIVNQVSPDNQQRIIAEQSFNHVVAQNPSQALNDLIGIASNDSITIPIRQSALLHLKRLVPKYWSPAFTSFAGPDCISQEVKTVIRSKLMILITDADSKLRNSSSYAIIQISLVDYPDEWPSLLNDLYSLINSNDFNKMLGSLTVLKDLFDDLVTEDQFFEGGVGQEVILNCSNLLCNESIPLEIRIETVKLFEICLIQLSTQLNLNASRKTMISKVVSDSFDLMINLLSTTTDSQDYNSILKQAFKFEIYKCLNSISNNFNHLFNKKIANNASQIAELVIKDLSFLNGIKFDSSEQFKDYEDLLKIQVTNFEISKFINDLFGELFQFFTSVCQKFSFNGNTELTQAFVDILIQVSVLPESVKEEWSGDFNSFVTLESGLSIDFYIRNAVLDYLIDLTEDSQLIFNFIHQRFNQIFQDESSSVDLKEAILFLLGALFQNEEILQIDFSIINFLNQLIEILSLYKDEFLVTRLILIFPRFFTKFENQLDLQNFGLKTLEQILQYQYTELTKSSILFAFTYFNYFIRSKSMNPKIQHSILDIIISFRGSTDEDAKVTLLECLSIAICIDNKELVKSTDVLELIFEICFEDSSNLGLIDSGRECLHDLFQDLTDDEFLIQCNKGLPFLVNIITQALQEKVEFTPVLDLLLEFLITFIDEEKTLTPEIFNFIFSPLTRLILSTDDDQLLQVSNEVFNKLLNHENATQQISNYENGLDILLQIVSKYLSPDLSDQAILNVGDLIIKLIQNFANNSNISQYLDQILQTVTRRLIIAKEFPTIENLILIFANLAITSPLQTLQFLSNFEINQGDKLIYHIIPIWLNTFETVRGYNKIILNIKALVEIFLLKDPTLNKIMVNSDELVPDESLNDKIITRSMRKNLKFIQIPASLKIVKLFINELKFQLSQPGLETVKSAIGLIGNKQQAEVPQDDEWEDVNEFEEYAQYDDDDDDDDSEAGDAADRTPITDNEEELRILKTFFRKTGGDEYFKDVFMSLKEDEKSLLTDFVNR